jgi:hypothetical protein
MRLAQWNWYHLCEAPEVAQTHHHGYGQYWDPHISRIAGMLIKSNRYSDLLFLLHRTDDWSQELDHMGEHHTTCHSETAQ